MKISTKGRYGLRAILDLAIYSRGNKLVLLSEISRRQKISKKYLSQIMNLLIRAGFVKSVRGKNGGYLLGKSPKNINVFDVLQVLEGDLQVIECVPNPSSCDRAGLCAIRDVWKMLSERIHETLSSITLEDLMKNQAKKFKNLIYNI